jgi:GNAT superfamily N-acetyltransferase
MTSNIREILIEDQDQVNILCKTIWEGNDYVPGIFSIWVQNPLARTMGLFDDNELVAMGTIEKTEGTNIAWIQGLRVKDGYRLKGHATSITRALVDIAKELGITHLWYATSSKNEASMKVAEKSGFHRADQTGYFRLFKPFPLHSKPSPSIVPLKASPDRLYEILVVNPDLVESSTFPLAWHFDFKTLEGLSRLLKDASIRVVVDETGVARGLYCHVERRERVNENTIAFTVFATDRSVFVDIMSRMIDEATSIHADRAVFFLGPWATEWALDLGYMAEEFVDRKFLLYEMNPVEK